MPVNAPSSRWDEYMSRWLPRPMTKTDADVHNWTLVDKVLFHMPVHSTWSLEIIRIPSSPYKRGRPLKLLGLIGGTSEDTCRWLTSPVQHSVQLSSGRRGAH